MYVLTLKAPVTTSADILKYIFYISKTRSGISCALSARQTIHRKFEAFCFWGNKKKLSATVINGSLSKGLNNLQTACILKKQLHKYCLDSVFTYYKNLHNILTRSQCFIYMYEKYFFKIRGLQ